MKRVFVTGGAGVIGLEIVPRLVERGAIVMVGDLKPRPLSFGKEIIFWQGDLNKIKYQVLVDFQPDTIIHLAATFERSDEAYDFWQENYCNNVSLSHYILSLAKDLHSLRRFVFASSYLIYDPSCYQFNISKYCGVSLSEDTPIRPRNLTGMAKLSYEMELNFISKFKSHQFSCVSARIFRGYGCNSRDVISRWIRSLLIGEPINVYRPEGLFDYIYAADSAEGLIRLAEAAHVPAIVNLGSGKARRVQDVIDVLKTYFSELRITNVETNILYEASEANMTRYKKYINWEPVYTIETAIPEIIKYERQKLDKKTNPIKNRDNNVLVTSAGGKVPLLQAAKDAVGRLSMGGKIIAGDVSDNVLSKYVADGFWKMPPTNDEDVEDIINGCLDREISVVLPTRDGELRFWSKHAKKFKSHGITVIVSSPTSVERCLDKLAFARFGSAFELSVIPTSENIDELVGTRFVVKNRFGSGSRGIGLDLSREMAILHSKTVANPIFQPFVEGTEFSVDAWVDSEHIVKELVLRWRDEIICGESRVTTTFSDPVIENYVRMAIERLELNGPIVLQGIINKTGTLHLIECNARFGGASTAGIAAGVDSLYWSFLEVFYNNIDKVSTFIDSRKVRQVRIPLDIHFYDSNI